MNQKAIIIIPAIIILLSAILIGSPLDSNIEIVNIIISISTIGYIIWNCKKKKEKIYYNKLDIFVILFMISTCIPLIFGSYISLEKTLISVFQNISVIAMYFFIKQIKIENHKCVENIIIISGVIIFIIGLDDLTTRAFKNMLQTIGILDYRNTENRLIANLGYPNSAAIIMAFSSFLALGLSLKNKTEKSDLYYGIVNFFFILGIILTTSKGTILCYAFFIIMYIILIKEKNLRIEIILKTIATILSMIIYVALYNKLLPLENYIGIWILTILYGIINGLLWITIRKTSIYFSKITKKQIIIVIVIIILLTGIVFTYGINKTEPLTIFTTEEEKNEYIHYIYNVDGNTKYNLNFEIELKTDKQNGYKIQIIEENKYDKEITTHEVEIGNFIGNKEFEFTTDSNTERFKIRFWRRQQQENDEMTIKKLTVNGEEIVLKYSYLPMSLVQIFQKMNLENKTAWEREVFIIDGLKIAKENLLFGVGGNGWEYTYGKVQQYNYYSTQSHCFYTQVLIENGILGGISILGIIICIVIYSIKYLKQQRNINYITILCAIRSSISAQHYRF